MNESSHARLRRTLCELGEAIRDAVVAARAGGDSSMLASVDRESSADTIFKIDRVGEEAITRFFTAGWPAAMPVEVVMEGLEGNAPLTFPPGTSVESTEWKCILDPIDGTRGLMYDKRPAWVLAAVAPQRGAATNLSDIVVAAMTELPVLKQDRCDQVSAIKGQGRSGIVATRTNLVTGYSANFALQPSGAVDFRNGYAGLSRFFPEGKALTALIEEDFWSRIFELGRTASPLVFEDQYASTGGQIYELLAGRDRMAGDIRPLVFAKLGIKNALACHPYDICSAMILAEAGGVIESPLEGGPLKAPLDTTSPVAWLGFANPRLAELAGPMLRSVFRDHGLS